MDREALRAWLVQLDQMTYYQLLGARPGATVDEISGRFHEFSRIFHPDQHITRREDERNAIGRIYRRGAEAYRTLLDPTLRIHYDQGLQKGEMRLDTSRAPSAAGGTASVAPRPVRLEDQVKSPAARNFVRRAEELAKRGDMGQAKLQIKLALNMDPGNAALIAFEKTLTVKKP
jgi:DnaJ-class molecular chaperone